MARLTCIGTADAFNAGGRGHSCYWVEDDLGNYMVDFGPTALLKCQTLDLDLDTLDGIYITHMHGDHIGGLASLLVYLMYRLERERPLTLAGPPGLQKSIAHLWESAYPSILQKGVSFPLVFKTFEVPGATEIMGRKLVSIRAKHDRMAAAASILIDNGRESLAFSGDTGWQDALPTLVRDAHLFVCECTEVESGYWGHLSVEELMQYRSKLKVEQLLLSHFSEPARAMATRQTQILDAWIADDGMMVEVAAAGVHKVTS